MPQTFFELADRLDTTVSSDQFWSGCLGALEKFGVTSVCYGVVPFLSEAKHRGLTSAEMIIAGNQFSFWHDENVWKDASSEQIEQAMIENELGLDTGVSMPLCNGGPDRVAAGIGLNIPDIKKVEFGRYWSSVRLKSYKSAHFWIQACGKPTPI